MENVKTTGFWTTLCSPFLQVLLIDLKSTGKISSAYMQRLNFIMITVLPMYALTYYFKAYKKQLRKKEKMKFVCQPNQINHEVKSHFHSDFTVQGSFYL